ncbi:hypothetical protein EC988_003227 [Linderina pennispora]|nr:hypothetical protein EC988_003227 [Linderina pennispora]
MSSIFRRPQAPSRQLLTWEERAHAALAAAREVEELSGESVPTRPSEVSVSRRLYHGPRYALPGSDSSTQAAKLQTREEPCTVTQANMNLRTASLHLSSVVLETPEKPDSVTSSPYFSLSFVVDALVPLTINCYWLATEEWGNGPCPRFVSRTDHHRSYQMEAGLDQMFSLPRADWLHPNEDPYKTLASSDWQARNAALQATNGSCPSATAPLPDSHNSEAIEMQAMGGSEIQEIADGDAQKAPAYGLVVELVDKRPPNPVERARQISFIEFYRDARVLVPRCVKQKVFLDGMLYLQYEIYGLGDAPPQSSMMLGNGEEESVLQCAICLSDELDTPRIVGGELAANQAALPFIAYISNSLNHRAGRSASCTGTILSDRWVITAGHCVYNRDEWDREVRQTPAPPQYITLTVGSIAANRGQVHQVSQVILHPDIYTSAWGTSVYADVALLQTTRPIGLGGSVQRAEIAKGVPMPLPQNTNVATAGWGGDGSGKVDTLHVLFDQQTANHTDCSMRRTDKGRLEETGGLDLICTSHMLNHTTCVGDGGSPLFIRTDMMRSRSPDGATYAVLGVLSSKSSNTVQTSNCYYQDGYDVYISLLYFIDWIANTTSIERTALELC